MYRCTGWPKSLVNRAASEFGERPRTLGLFMNQLKGLSDVRVRHCAKPPSLTGIEGFDPAAQRLDEEHFGHPREHGVLPGMLNCGFDDHALQEQLEPAVVLRPQVQKRRKGFQNADARGARQAEIAADHGRDRSFSAAMSNRPEMRWPTIEIEQGKRLCAAATREEMGLAARDENEVARGHANRPTVL